MAHITRIRKTLLILISGVIFPSAPNLKEEEQPGRRIRRNSDSFLCFKPNDDEVALMKLMEREENKWRDERQILELKIAKLQESRNAEKTSEYS